MNNLKLDRHAAIFELYKRGNLSWKLDPFQKGIHKLLTNTDQKIIVTLCSRRNGKCLAKGTLVMTPNGPKAIETLQIGEEVYGYNKDGTLSPSKVLDVMYQGTKEVYDLNNHHKTLAICTNEHTWLTQDSRTKQFKELKLKNFNNSHTTKIVRKFIKAPLGLINEPHAYAIGALLGDGCSKQNGPGSNQIFISSENNIIPTKVQKVLDAKFLRKNGSSKNYTWVITNNEIHKKTSKVHCNYYQDWIGNRYAHEKIVDLEVIKTWNRTSLLEFVAGLIDTDGSVVFYNKEIIVQFCSQSESMMKALQYAILALWQYDANYFVEKRDKYVNGPMHYLSIKNIYFCKEILKELTPHLVLERKKYKQEYDSLIPHNMVEEYVGVVKENKRQIECYDISIDNDTKLYSLANGLITHNSWCAVVLAVEHCLKKPNSIVKFLAGTKLQVNNTIRPLIKQILDDAPDEYKPNFLKSQYTYFFPNGSELQLAGSDNGHAEKLRGGYSDLCIVDEAQECNDLTNTVRSVLIPTTLNTRGKILIIGTYPKDLEHDFLKFVEEAEGSNSLIKKTIFDNPRITKEEIDEIIAAYPGGINNPDFKREFLCVVAKDSSKSVIPEFTEDLEKDIVKDWPMPPYYDNFVSMDLGGKDLTAVLFAYYDFRANRVIIQDELVMDFQLPDNNIKKLTVGIKETEERLWTNVLSGEVKKPTLRVSDINPIVIKEIATLSAQTFGQNNIIGFATPQKDDAESAINKVRMMLAAKQIIIHPRCEQLIRHLRNVKWQSTSKLTFARSPIYGHYDLVSALIYLIRSIDYGKNPYPYHYGFNVNTVHIDNPKNFENPVNNSQMEVYKKMFNIKPSRRF